jgi:hypothetical protein
LGIGGTNRPANRLFRPVIRELRRKEEAEDEIDAATDLLTLNKANAKLKSAQWSLERVCRRIYGETKEPERLQNITINIGIKRQPVTPITKGGVRLEDLSQTASNTRG